MSTQVSKTTKGSAVEDTGLATRQEFSAELAPTGAAAMAQHEIQSAIVLAQRFPRNEVACFERLMRSAKRPAFAEEAAYSFPRGDKTVTGPSVYLAREAARCWGNIRYALDILRDDGETMHIRGWCWDLETNLKVSADDQFKKLIYRKSGGWVTPDERDLRELVNRRGAILVRNSILQVLPVDLIEDALMIADQTLASETTKDPEGERKKLVVAFSDLYITPTMLESYIGHPLGQASPAEITKLRGVYKSIKDGNSTWRDYVAPETPKPPRESGSLSDDDLAPSNEPNRGHGNEGFPAPATEPQTTPSGSLFDGERTTISEDEANELAGLIRKAHPRKAAEATDDLLAKYGVATLLDLAPGDFERAKAELQKTKS